MRGHVGVTKERENSKGGGVLNELHSSTGLCSCTFSQDLKTRNGQFHNYVHLSHADPFSLRRSSFVFLSFYFLFVQTI